MSAGAQTALERIVDQTRVALQRRKREVPLDALRRRAAGQAHASRPAAAAAADPAVDPADGPRGFRAALSGHGVSIVAEFKRRSPSAGPLRERSDLVEIVRAYERGGASAVSVLTEGPNFGGSLSDLESARTACALPVLRKDFIVDPYQLHEARAAGADAALLIVAALGQPELVTLHELALSLGMDALVEVHDAEELRRAEDAGARLIGVNNRDLRDFSVDVRRTFALLERMPAAAIVVSESGIGAREQLHELHEHGVHAVLVGEALMRAPDPERALSELLAVSGAL